MKFMVQFLNRSSEILIRFNSIEKKSVDESKWIWTVVCFLFQRYKYKVLVDTSDKSIEAELEVSIS